MQCNKCKKLHLHSQLRQGKSSNSASVKSDQNTIFLQGRRLGKNQPYNQNDYGMGFEL